MGHTNLYCLSFMTGCLMVALTPFAQAQLPAERPPGLPQLIVVADHGGTSARPYFVAIKGSGVDEDEGFSPQTGVPPRPTQRYGERDMLPIESERLTPGPVMPRDLNLPGGFTPLFLIGDDALSRQWLAERGDILRELNAVGLVIQVQDEQALQALRDAAQGLELRPASGDGLADRLGLSHYPVLINQHGIEQ
ncbi:integrating conjugative element protein [Halomonas sp. McH1-25]|uniref:integrating conjugative element protein n=1 Tax=unclassified Halomonas TaxID=2609666 RepID=UPI001EF598A9|nr:MULTISPECIES: integrating conjugative element protein [unclassified Halomonas]MCG7601775.1 integrating conjugative element protein [Halomonas sp. McH1-25]MCP1344628.1 integrating conjugative element protein [Halomonas sp. FL8]MCP1363111.1 integrating conjugative element protein [Halomonas sp. BBD45]MCP1367701.1 integrating conjugative element protein [Halomonas sp. BBD48]